MTSPPDGPRGVTSYQEFLNRHTEIVRELSGADKSDWNGDLESTPDSPDEVLHGQAAPDGTLRYHDEHVYAVLQDAFDNPGKARSREELITIRDALETTLHESAHLLSRSGTDRQAAHRSSRGVPGVKGFEEGVTEAWSLSQLNRYIKALDFERIAPGISKVRGRNAYPAFTPAADALATRISELSRENGRPGLSTTEVLRRLNNVNRAEKWPAAADLVLESSGLADRIPEGPERDAARQRVADAMREEFAATADLDEESPGVVDDSRAIGRRAFGQGMSEVRLLELQYQEGELGPGFQWDPGTEQDWEQDEWLRGPAGDLSVGDQLVEPSPYVAAEVASAATVEDLRDQLDAEAEREANDADPNRVYATDTLAPDRTGAEAEWDRQQADPNRQYVAEVQEEPESVRTERLAAEQGEFEPAAGGQAEGALGPDQRGQVVDADFESQPSGQDVGQPGAEPSPYVAGETAVPERSVGELQSELDSDAARDATEANPDRVYATDTLTTDRELAEEEWRRQQADPNRQYVADVQEEPESVRTERLAAEQAAAEQVDNDLDSSLDSDFDEPGLRDEGFDGQGADTVDRGDFDPAATNQWAPPATTDRLDRPVVDQQQDPQQQNVQQTAQQTVQQRDVQQRDDLQVDGQDRGGAGLEAGDRDPSRSDREGERPEDRPDRDQQPAAETDGRDSAEWPQHDPDERDPQQDPSQRDARDDRQDVDRLTQDQSRQDQDRQNPNQRDPNERDEARDDRPQADRQQGPQRDPNERDGARDDREQADRQQGGRQQDAQRDPSQPDQARDGQGRDGQRDPSQRDPNQRGGAQQDPRQQDPRQQGQQRQQDPRQQDPRQQDPRQQDPRQQDPRQQGQRQQDPRQQQGQRDPRMQAQGRQQPGQDPRQDPRQQGQRDPRQQRQPQKQSARNQAAKKLSDTARKAPQQAEAILDAADPQGQGGRRRQSRQQGSGSDPFKKLKQLKDGGQRSPRGAGRPPSGPPKATPHGRGVHNAGQHNQNLKDQHTPQREQGEGRELEN